MTYTPQPVDTTSPTPLPMSSVVPDSTNTPLAVRGGPAVSTGGNSNSSPAVYTYDGDNVTFGAMANAAATTDAGTFTFMALVKRLLGKLLVGQQTMAASVGVVIASDQSNLPGNTKQLNGTTISVNAGNRDAGTQRIIESGNPTPTVTQVGSSATSATILAANANKKGTLFFNDSTAILYLLYGIGTASTTNYSVQIPAKGYFEDPFHYTGGFSGIWSAANGFVYCTEVS